MRATLTVLKFIGLALLFIVAKALFVVLSETAEEELRREIG